MDAETVIQRWQTLRRERRNHETIWEQEARLFNPARRNFTSDSARSLDPMRGLFTSDPIMAANNLRSGLYGTLTNPATPWMSFSIADPDLADRQPVKEWLGTCSRRVLASFGTSMSSFYPETIRSFRDIVIHGNSGSYEEIDTRQQRIRDIAVPLDEIVILRDAYGLTVEAIRRFRLTAQQIRKKWPEITLPATIAKAWEKNDATKFVLLHHVAEQDWLPGRIGAAGKPYGSVYVAEDDKAVLKRGGYYEMPYTYPSWDRDAGDTYGHGVAYTATPAARVLNTMEGANLEAGERAARPTILAPHRNAVQYAMKPNPGTVLYGAMANGRRQIDELGAPRQTGLSLEMAQRKSEEIKDGFYWSLMQLVGRSGMTATEVLERQAEKLRLMAPHLGNIQHEYLAPKVNRRFALLWRAGQLPPPPPEMEGNALDIEYQSAAALAAKSAEGAGVVRLLEDLAPLMAVDPRYAARIDPDGVVETLMEARGAPARVLRSRDEADALQQQQAEAAQAAEQMAQIEQGAGIVRDLATAVPAGSA